jgi:hypothetical protein
MPRLAEIPAAVFDLRAPSCNTVERNLHLLSTRNALMKKILLSLLLTFALLAFGEKIKMKNVSTLQPAAAAQLTHEKDDNGNTKLKIHVYHLAKPDSLTPPRDTYVVWIEPPGQPPQNMGVIKVNDNLESEFSTRTPFKKFKVYITAEDGPKVTTPSGDKILEAYVDRD